MNDITLKNPNMIIPSETNDKFETVGQTTVDNPKISARNVTVSYGSKTAIKNVSIDIAQNEVLAMIGPSGCGKSTFLRCLNRMNDSIDICKVSGEILLDDQNILDKIIQNDSKDDTRVVILCMVDNFGICHAPFAQGNFYLYIYYI